MYNLEGHVSRFQIQRFEAIQGFLGGCISNIGELSKSISTLVGLHTTLAPCAASVKRVETDPESNMYMFRQLYAPIDAARAICDKVFETEMTKTVQQGIQQNLMSSLLSGKLF